MFVADLLEDARSVVAIFPGRFHPFHKGHAYMYQQLVSRYGRDRSFIATSNKVELPKSPFSFSDKAQMMRVAGIPADKTVETRNPYQAQEIVGNFDPASTVLIFAVSQKDMDEDPRFSFKPKKDGSPSYFQPLPDDLKNAKTLDQHGYITTLPTLDFTVLGEPMRSATELRAKYAAADDDTRKAIIKDLYGTYSEEIKHIMDNKIGDNVSTSVDESILGRILHSDQYKKAAKIVRDLAKKNPAHSAEYWAAEVIRRNSLELDARTLAKQAMQTEEVDLSEDLNFVATGGAFGKKRRFPTFVVKKEGIKYKAYDEQDNMSLKASSNSLSGLANMLKPYIEKRIGGTWKLEEDWRKSLTAAAVALGVAGAPATADAGLLDAIVKLGRSYGNISKITTKGVEAEINQELKNQMRNDPSSRNLRLQNRNKRTEPTQNRWGDNATIKGSNESVREGVGRIVKGVNTTPDVGVNQVSIEAAKFGSKVDKDGRPPTLSTKVKGKSTNVAFNLGLTESLYKLNRDDPMNSEVLITGMGRYNIKTLHKNLAEKLKDLSERMASMDPDQAQQARYLLTKSPLIPMMDALQQAYDDLKEIKRKGGVRSRGIDL